MIKSQLEKALELNQNNFERFALKIIKGKETNIN